MSYRKTMPWAILLSVCAMPLFADEPMLASQAGSTVTVNTIASSLPLSPARYTASIMPAMNGAMGTRLEKAFSTIHGLSDVKATPDDSSIHFTVKNSGQIRTADLQKLLTALDNNAVMSAPILEHSMATPH